MLNTHPTLLLTSVGRMFSTHPVPLTGRLAFGAGPSLHLPAGATAFKQTRDIKFQVDCGCSITAVSDDWADLFPLYGHPAIRGYSKTSKGYLEAYLSKVTLELDVEDSAGNKHKERRDLVVQIVGGVNLFGLDALCSFDMTLFVNRKEFSVGKVPPPASVSLMSWGQLLKKFSVQEKDLQPITKLPLLNAPTSPYHPITATPPIATNQLLYLGTIHHFHVSPWNRLVADDVLNLGSL